MPCAQRACGFFGKRRTVPVLWVLGGWSALVAVRGPKLEIWPVPDIPEKKKPEPSQNAYVAHISAPTGPAQAEILFWLHRRVLPSDGYWLEVPGRARPATLRSKTAQVSSGWVLVMSETQAGTNSTKKIRCGQLGVCQKKTQQWPMKRGRFTSRPWTGFNPFLLFMNTMSASDSLWICLLSSHTNRSSGEMCTGPWLWGDDEVGRATKKRIGMCPPPGAVKTCAVRPVSSIMCKWTRPFWGTDCRTAPNRPRQPPLCSACVERARNCFQS